MNLQIQPVSITTFENKTSKLEKLDPDYFSDPNLPVWFTDPLKSIENCILTQHCTNDTKLTQKYNKINPKIPNADFNNFLGSPNLQTNPNFTQVQYYFFNKKFLVKLTSFDGFKAQKTYGGDVWISRIILQTSINLFSEHPPLSEKVDIVTTLAKIGYFCIIFGQFFD